MKKEMTEEERKRVEEIRSIIEMGQGRLAMIADEQGKLQNGLKVARMDAGDGHIFLKIGSLDEICELFGIERPIDDSLIPIAIKHAIGAKVTISDKLTDKLTDENVHVLG
ncbi:MAG: hypothetical protein IK092_02705 [Muribaculaceae bacterium]|nr:hypothetical protein [Muribaculaceae bacterium]